MEKQLFTWDGWDEQGTAAFTFYKPTLVVPIGDFPVGTTFNNAFVDYEKGQLAFYNDAGEEVSNFNLTLQVHSR